MIFNSVNEKGEKKIDKILAMKTGEQMMTRRLKPVRVGKTVAVQPNRGKKQVCKIQIISCIEHKYIEQALQTFTPYYQKKILKKEAKIEGFYTWEGLLQWFKEHDIDIMETYRIEFKKI